MPLTASTSLESRLGTSYSTRTSNRTSRTTGTTSYPTLTYQDETTATSRARSRRSRNGRPSTSRPKTSASTVGRVESQQVICAVSESRGVSPTVGLTFVNMDTGEAVLSQLCDSQTYVKTIHKLSIYCPTEVLIIQSAANPASKLFQIIENHLPVIASKLVLVDRRYWSEQSGMDYIKSLCFPEDVDSLIMATNGSFYAVCCVSAAFAFIQHQYGVTFPHHSLRFKYEPSEGSMMIDLSTVQALELIQNLHNSKSKDCLFGLLNGTLTPMGARLLRANILQPLTDPDIIQGRLDALEEMTTNSGQFRFIRDGTCHAPRKYSMLTSLALKNFLDGEKLLTQLITVYTAEGRLMQEQEQAINNVLSLKSFVNAVPPVHDALLDSTSTLLRNICQLCDPLNISEVQQLIDSVVDETTIFASKPLDLRNQRTYAVKEEANGLLGIARQSFAEAQKDTYDYVTELAAMHGMNIAAKYDNYRQYYLVIPLDELEVKELPPIFTNIIRKKNAVECQTLDLLKWNQKISDAHHEVLKQSDETVLSLLEQVRGRMYNLYKICESVAMLDMLASFAEIATTKDYVRPLFTDTLAIKAGRHAIVESIQGNKFIPNDVYATRQTRFQIITGKSTYIRSIALMTIMAQIGCFVPAQHASFSVRHQMFARLSLDDSIEANTSTFAAEMRETAFILRNVSETSMVIIDELGRGTSTKDGMAIAIAIAEALIESGALVWFTSHFLDLASILGEHNGVTNMHLAVDLSNAQAMTMLYRISAGQAKEQHYGLKSARLMQLPATVLDTAQTVAEKIERNRKELKQASSSVQAGRRRRLILEFHEHLKQAHNGRLEGQALKNWLNELQDEFITRMTAINSLSEGG
ncbi:hypothetical protein P152DRAFT_464551 [Eremomyces bilateralis CBS 781.70]|uniref:DNA mismatch repair protein MSH3 n=1 Tax=Eremomyces bilateralis CBS 781.70 TaxID=1392243 RepID=A0A6G1GCR7_9PEZI|nr:uncharacterized protein P152DRAFT_464551 [Eremomyces bilateralis CBS 781.70]KAF1815823.1 hypothetical protein P152DRAFT_464551 [Eremomyces bilateralis CBS 781.70]